MYVISPYEDGGYSGGFDTFDAAVEEGLATFQDHFWVGKVTQPTPPEKFFTREQIIHWVETVDQGEDYTGDWVEDWYKGTKEQETELVDQLREVISAWLDKHNLRPKHFVVEVPERIDCQKEIENAETTSLPKRIDREGRDVTDLPGLWSESDKIGNL